MKPYEVQRSLPTSTCWGGGTHHTWVPWGSEFMCPNCKTVGELLERVVAPDGSHWLRIVPKFEASVLRSRKRASA